MLINAQTRLGIISFCCHQLSSLTVTLRMITFQTRSGIRFAPPNALA